MIRLRFAPSPTGYMHVGNARTALFNYLHARKTHGKLVVRIEDTDLARSSRKYEKGILQDLEWLGIEWDEGPDRDGDFGPYRQSERTEIYQNYAQKLLEQSAAYYCFCKIKESTIERKTPIEKGGLPLDSCLCARLNGEESKLRISNGEKGAIRFAIPADTAIGFNDIVRGDVSFDSNLLSDPVILRSNGIPAYNFSVVVDDFLMKINLVIRGEDHISNTAKQVALGRSLNFPLPQFAHLSMVMGADNSKLSKRHGSTAVSQFRKEGYLPEALMNYLALLGWAAEGGEEAVFTPEKLAQSFSLNTVSKSASIFDYQKLKWLNREHIRLLGNCELGQRLSSFLVIHGIEFVTDEHTLEWIGSTVKILSNYHYLLSEIAGDFIQFATLTQKKDVYGQFNDIDDSKKVIDYFFKAVKQHPSPVGFNKVVEILKNLQKDLGIKGKGLYHPLRLALTGKESGIELQDFISIIESGSVLSITPKIKNMASRLELFVE